MRKKRFAKLQLDLLLMLWWLFSSIAKGFLLSAEEASSLETESSIKQQLPIVVPLG
jgi:hypothetical protein